MLWLTVRDQSVLHDIGRYRQGVAHADVIINGLGIFI